MIRLIRKIFELVYSWVPRRNTAVLYSWPDLDDNILALELALQSRRIDRVIILRSTITPENGASLGQKTKQVKKNSILGICHFLTSKYVFFTHPCFARRFPDDVISVNVWHGMPIKRIGYMLPGSHGIASSHALATSPFWADIMDRSMHPSSPSLSLGLPRNDRLFECGSDTSIQLGVSSKRLIIWLPTYRISKRGEIRNDGKEYGNVFEMPDIDPHSLNDFLASRDALLLVKPHPMAAAAQDIQLSNLKIIFDSWITDRGLSLYQTVGACDILITDISSVMIDFLLSDRPVIHAFPDIEEYRNSRGFSVDPIEDFFAGEVVTNQKELLAALDLELSGKDPHAEKRRSLGNLSHTYHDNQSTKRLLDAIELE